jgi:unsaturated rhamnogalacturonyl hydrolase
VDSLVDSQGNLYTNSSHSTIRALDALDHIMPGRLILDVYDHLPKTNYRTALQTLRNRFSEASNSSGAQPTWSSPYPRTSDDGYYHAESKPGELWLDGAFMGQTFLHRYGQKFGGADETYADDEGTQQIIIQFGHLKDDVSGLLWHAYDEERDASWPFAPGTNHSQEFWCRAMGWYGMAIVEILDVLDPNHPNRPQLISILQGLVEAWADFQDPASGRWFQLVDKGSNPENWTETSCSAMYSYTISRAVRGGFVDAGYATVASDGFDGVLEKISFGANATLAADLTNVTDICEGTSIGDEAYYFDRNRPVNDPRGLGALLIMYEHFAEGSPAPAPSPPSHLVAADGVGRCVLRWDDNSSDEAGFEIERKPQSAPDTSFVQIGQVGADAVTYTDGVAAGSYTYRVRAFAGALRSAYSNSDDATVTAPPPPGCGIGPELAFVIPLLHRARGRRQNPRDLTEPSRPLPPAAVSRGPLAP